MQIDHLKVVCCLVCSGYMALCQKECILGIICVPKSGLLKNEMTFLLRSPWKEHFISQPPDSMQGSEMTDRILMSFCHLLPTNLELTPVWGLHLSF